ncbi:MAG: penicillin-binding protein 2 [Lachnospiraceae bacterium]|nr:penicillin-binding protein 2 [Lachnospiraceae bacterium]
MNIRSSKKRGKKGSAESEKIPVKVREVRLEQESEPADAKGRNTELGIVTYAFVFLFVIMIGYLVYLNVWKADSLNSSSYNTKQDTNEDKYIRGSIYSADGQTLAYTSVAEDGTETRVYPYKNVFSHVIGYSSNGKSGLESTSNSDLMTSHTSVLTQLREDTDDDEKQQADSVYTTLNATLQQTAYNALGSYNGAVIVMEPDTGKILAMVSKPDFDPNDIENIWDEVVNDSSSSVLLNRATQGLYPPGSTFKILTTLAYMRENSTTYSDFTYNCEGTLEESGASIHCYNNKVHGLVDLKNAFAKSCNTTFASIGLSLGEDSLADVCDEFLFNSALPTSLQHSTSQFTLSSNASYGEIMQTAIGQGETLVTPLHMALITSTVANGGVMMRPYLVDYIEAVDGTTVSTNSPSRYKKLMTSEEASVLNEYMEETVLSGTATALSWFDRFTVAGKTGSAEYGSDGSEGTHSWFVGYSTSDEADIVVVVIAEDGGAGSDTAVPIASQIFQAYYNML